VADFLFVIVELFSLALTDEMYKQILVADGAFQRGVGLFERKFYVHSSG